MLKLIVPALALGIAGFYLMSRHKADVDLKLESQYGHDASPMHEVLPA